MNLCEWLCPRFNVPESNAPRGWVAVAVCGALSLFTHLTVVPGATVMWDGWKAKSLMFTVTVLPCAPAVGAKSSRATSESAANDGSILLIRVPPHLSGGCSSLLIEGARYLLEGARYLFGHDLSHYVYTHVRPRSDCAGSVRAQAYSHASCEREAHDH